MGHTRSTGEFSMARWTVVRRFVLLAFAAALTACSEPTTAPPIDESEATPNVIVASGLIECRRALFDIDRAILGPLGGVLSLDGHQIIVPPGALTSLALVTLRQPATRFVEVDVRVNGLAHFQFAKPVTVVLDYSRCRRRMIPPGPLTVWQIDPVTKAFIRDMNGVDNREARKISFTTDHFSGYAVAQ
jgi:hypothetical protein